MAEAEDHRPLQSKRKAVSALLPYAVWRERDGQPEVFDTILYAARASKMYMFTWSHVSRFVSTRLPNASPRAIVLASPQVSWFPNRWDLIHRWVAAVSTVPHTKEVAASVVDTLLQIASQDELGPHIPIGLWSWLTERPPLPYICRGRCFGTRACVVKAVRALDDIEILKSYLLLVWSEWDLLWSDGFVEMCTLIWEDFRGIGMGQHRADLIQRLDHVLAQLDRGLEYIKQHEPSFNECDLRRGEAQYRKLRETLLIADQNAQRSLSLYSIHTFTSASSAQLVSHRLPCPLWPTAIRPHRPRFIPALAPVRMLMYL